MGQPAARVAAEGPVVTRLALADFRNYRSLRLEPDVPIVALTGPNGSGKTNLLEALSLLAPGRGLRRARSGEITRHGAGADAGWAVSATLSTPFGGSVDIGTGAGEGERRVVRIDGAARRGQSALGPYVSALWITPRMDRLFADGAAERRRFLDRLVQTVDPAHSGRVAAYGNAMRQRLSILRDGRGDPAWLRALEAVMAGKGVAMAASRRDFVERLRVAMDRMEGPFPKAVLALAGDVDHWLAEGPALAAEERLASELVESRTRDAETGRSHVGPHRSDLEVADTARAMPASACSTGERKALLISVVLASARLPTVPPLLLLDEVAAHLDAGRRAALYDGIGRAGGQAWLTGTDSSIFAPLAGRARHFRVEAGVLVPSRMEPS